MSTLRRTVLALSALLAPISASASPIAEIHTDSESLRFALPDFVYATGVTADFQQLQLIDAEGGNLPFAICPSLSAHEAWLDVAVLEVPSIARVVTDGHGDLQLEFSPGARHPGVIQDWVIDSREVDGAIAEFKGLPPISQLRSGPNLRQWSAPLSFEQRGDSIVFSPLRSPYFRVRLSQQKPAGEAKLRARLQERSGERQPHWYSLESLADGQYGNRRKLPVIAARVPGADADGWRVESRQGDWDAWKPRARVPPGEPDAIRRFSAVTDPQWRLQGSEGPLELAHPAYELRLPRISPARPLRLLRLEQGRFGPALSCTHTEGLATRAPDRIVALDSGGFRAPSATDLRGYFLILVGIGLALGLAWRRYRKARLAG